MNNDSVTITITLGDPLVVDGVTKDYPLEMVLPQLLKDRGLPTEWNFDGIMQSIDDWACTRVDKNDKIIFHFERTGGGQHEQPQRDTR